MICMLKTMHYGQLMYLRTWNIWVLKLLAILIQITDPAKFYSAPRLAWQAALKKDQSKTRSFNWYVLSGRKRY